MIKRTAAHFLLLVALFSNCSGSELSHVTGECKRIQQKRQECIVTTLLLCESVPGLRRDATGMDFCTSLDGGAAMIAGMCSNKYSCSSHTSEAQ